MAKRGGPLFDPFAKKKRTCEAHARKSEKKGCSSTICHLEKMKLKESCYVAKKGRDQRQAPNPRSLKKIRLFEKKKKKTQRGKVLRGKGQQILCSCGEKWLGPFLLEQKGGGTYVYNPGGGKECGCFQV